MQPLLPWIPALASLVLLLAVALLWQRNGRRSAPLKLPTEWALTARPVFNSDERRFYRQLREALPHHIVLSKLPLVRFCQPINPQEVRYWYELLGAAQVSFAICSGNGRVLAALDLEGDRGASRRSLQIKQSVLEACRVRYLRCQPDQLPSLAELQALVPLASPNASAAPASPVKLSRERLANTVASRRQERAAMWQDSTLESRFAASLLEEDIAGVVVDNTPAPLRH
jgi:hypothetical protein